MSKNLTRKGLALGALVGLASTAIAGTPAFAANELTFALSSGTVYAAPVDDTLTLNASLPSSIPAANVSQLKYKVATDGSLIAKVILTSGGVTDAAKYTKTGSTTGVGANNFASVLSSVVVKPVTTPTAITPNTIAVSVDSVADATTATTGVAPSATTATKAVTVTAFLDANNNDTLDSGEFSTEQVLSFKKYSDITADYTWTAPSAGATSVAAKATLTNINQNQLTKSVFLSFTQNAAGTAATAALTASSGVYSGTASYTVAAGDIFAVQLMLGTNSTSVATSTSTATATARTIDSIGTAAVVAGDNATAAGKFRDGGAFTVRTKVTKSSAAVAGVSGTATFSTGLASLSDTVYVTVNGTAYKTKTALEAASLALTSDADGYLSVSITTTGFTTGTVIVNFAAQNYTNTVTATGEVAVYYAVDVADVANVDARNLLSSATTTVTYQVMDQYGVAPADSTFRAVLTGAAAAYQPVAAGKATFTVTGGTTASQAYTIGLEKWVAASASYDTAYAEGSANDNGFTVYKAAAANVSAAGTLAVTTLINADGQYYATSQSGGTTASTTKLALSDKAFSSVDTRLDKKTTAPTLAAGYKTGPAAGTAAGNASVDITVIAKGSDVAATAIAAPVTLTGKGMLFVVNQGANGSAANTWSNVVYATDSITVLAPAGGVTVKVYSHTAGANDVVVTSGVASKTITLTYAAVAAEAATVVYGTLPAQAQAGRAVDLSAIVKDQWGNVVPGALVAFTNTGVGYVQSTAQVTSDANGKVTGRLIVLQNDLGTSYISATLDLATDVVVAKSVEFGLTDADVVSGGHRVFVNAEFALGRTVTVTIDGKRVYSKVQTTDNAVELAFTQKKAGAHTVTVRISGGIAFSEKVTTN